MTSFQHHRIRVRLFIFGLLLIACQALNAQGIQRAEARPDPVKPITGPRYEFRERHDPDGIGKFYLGREIAHVMGHEGAGWLERPERIEEEKSDRLVELLKLKPGDYVADVGAGTGYYSSRIAKKVAPDGKVYATDIQQEMLDLLQKQMKKQGITNVVSILGTIEHSKLPANTLDLVIMVDVYHEFSHPYEMLVSIRDSLKPEGRVAFVEFKEEDPRVPIKPVHKMSVLQVRKETEAAGLEWIETVRSLPWQHLIFFKKPSKEKLQTETKQQ